MKLKSYLHALILLLALSLAGCSTQDKDQEFIDPETIEKNAEFRSTIASGSFVKLSAGNTYYEIANQNADTVLVLVHGFSVPSYIWDSTYYAAQKRGYGVLRYDVYGRGYSDNPDVAYDGALYSEQLHELLEALKITNKINLVGLSYGGRIISAFAAQYPNRIQNIIYVDPAGFETINAAEYPAMVTDEEIQAFKQSESYKTMASGQLGDFYDATPFTGWDKKYESMMKYKGFVRALLSTRKNSPSMENEQIRIANAGLPVFCIWGDHDKVVELNSVEANIFKRIPTTQLYVISKAGHLPHMEQTRTFNAIVFDKIMRKKYLEASSAYTLKKR
jgi:pimeloyl-ACP methyl ester carboxylesterase